MEMMRMAFSEDTEMFPLSALLHNKAEEVPTFVKAITDADVQKYRNQTVSIVTGCDLENITYGEAVTISYLDGTTTRTIRVDPETITRVPDGTFLINTMRVKMDSTYWYQFGIEQVELPDNTPLMHAIWDRICLRVNETYYDRFLAGETMEQWQRRLQVITDKTIPRYERAFRLYTANATKIDTDIVTQQKTEYDVHDSGSNTSKSKVTDTPDTAINESQNYAGTVSEGSGTNGNDRTGSVTVTMEGAGGILDNINTNIQEWRDLESNLVDEYARAFLSLVWY